MLRAKRMTHINCHACESWYPVTPSRPGGIPALFQLYSSFIQSEPVIRQAKESLRLGVIPHTKAALWP
jgi:hypothetical protein